ncbi:MAG: terminase family protein [Phycisphaerae bacterium]
MGPVEAAIRNVAGLPAYQLAAVNAESRFTWNCWSRQTGKSFAFSLRRLLRGLARRRTQLFLSASERQSRELMEKVRNHCTLLRIAFELYESECFGQSALRRLEARLPGGVRVIALSANASTARGFSGDVFLDEFSMHAEDRAIWAAVFPSVLRGGGELDVASTPRGRRNVFAALRGNGRFARSTVTIQDAAAGGLAVDVEALRTALGDEAAWRQEFECAFEEESRAFLPHEVITRCGEAGLRKEPDEGRLADAGARLFVGVDLGRVRDLTVAWVWERTEERYVTRGVIELAGTSFAVQRRVLEQLLARPAVRRMCVDRGGLGMQLAEELAERFGGHRVEGVAFTADLKAELAGRLRVAAEAGELAVPVDDAIRSDWHSIERVMTTGGHVRYEADRSRGGHADRFWAAALGLHAARRPDGVIEYASGEALRFSRRGAW